MSLYTENRNMACELPPYNEELLGLILPRAAYDAVIRRYLGPIYRRPEKPVLRKDNNLLRRLTFVC